MPATALSPTQQHALRLLQMVHALHRRGYQGLRIEPCLSPSGGHWRCAISHAANTRSDHGALLLDGDQAARYSSADGTTFFGWTDAPALTVEQLAERFSQQFPDIVHHATAPDQSYAQWYELMLTHATTGNLPVAYADWYETPDPRHLPVTGPAPSRLPMPPAPPARSVNPQY